MFVEFYKKTSKSQGSEIAKRYFIDDMISSPKMGVEKSFDVTSMDMEKTLIGKGFIPSMIYTFLYNPTYKETFNKIKFIDCIPIILCTSFQSNGSVEGINFNLMPNNARAALLDVIYDGFKQFYSETIYNDEVAINNNMANILSHEDSLKKFLDIASSKNGVNFSNTVRRYNMQFISNARMIEYDMWKYIPFLSFSDSIREANLVSLQASIISNDDK